MAGQAKLRGSYEQRIEEAVKKREKKQLEQAIQYQQMLDNLPANAKLRIHNTKVLNQTIKQINKKHTID